MIFVPRPSAPAVFSEPMFRRAEYRAQRFFATPLALRRQRNFHFEPLWQDVRVIAAVRRLFSGKCAYCEQAVADLPKGTIEHFRPKSGALDLRGSVSQDHYWWLAYAWQNLYLCCKECNYCKGQRFPVEGKRASYGQSLDQERAVLIDPCGEPNLRFSFNYQGEIAAPPGDQRADLTIRILDLNRRPLVARRRALWNTLKTQWSRVTGALRQNNFSRASQILRTLLAPGDEFLGLRSTLLCRWAAGQVLERDALHTLFAPVFPHLDTAMREVALEAVKDARGNRSAHERRQFQRRLEGARAFLRHRTIGLATRRKRHPKIHTQSTKDDVLAFTRMIRRIEVKNLRGIRELRLEFNGFGADGAEDQSDNEAGLHARFPSIGAPWLLLLGENGTCKTTLLQAIALALGGPDAVPKHAPAHSYLRRGASAGYVRVFLTGREEPVELRFSRASAKFRTSEKRPPVLVMAYGAARLLRTEGANLVGSHPRARISNLFDPFTALSDGVDWMCAPRFRPRAFDLAARAIKALVPDGDNLELTRQRGRTKRPTLVARTRDGRIPVAALSSGYQSALSLALDIMKLTHSWWEAPETAEGIVLVDELDAHLHPRWKMQVVSHLRAAFPRLQFLVTSHEPLTLRGLDKGEVVVLRRTAQHEVISVSDLPSPKALRVDQLLTSEFFGMSSTIDPATERLFAEYYGLLVKRTLTVQEKNRLSALKATMAEHSLLGHDRRERMMLEAADRYLASERNLKTPDERADHKARADGKIERLWRSPGKLVASGRTGR